MKTFNKKYKINNNSIELNTARRWGRTVVRTDVRTVVRTVVNTEFPYPARSYVGTHSSVPNSLLWEVPLYWRCLNWTKLSLWLILVPHLYECSRPSQCPQPSPIHHGCLIFIVRSLGGNRTKLLEMHFLFSSGTKNRKHV